MKIRLFTLLLAIITSVVTIFAQQPLISIDGNFDDWSAVPSNILAQASLDLNSNPSYDGLFNMKFCMDDDYIFFYLEFTAEKDAAEWVHICMNLDGDGQGFNWWWWDNSAIDCTIEGNLSSLSDATLMFVDPNPEDPAWPWKHLDISNFIFTSDTIKLLNGHKAIEGKIVTAMISPEIHSFKIGVITYNSSWYEAGFLPQNALMEVPCNRNYLKVNIGGINCLLNENDKTASVTYEGYDLTQSGPYSDYSGEIIIPDFVQYNGKNYTVMRIGSCAFRNSSLTSINIPNSVTRIGEDAFYGCSSLSAIYVPICGEFERYKAMLENDNRVQYLPLTYSISIAPSEYGQIVYPTTICVDTVLSVIPNYGYHFAQWSDGSTDNPRIIELTQDTTFTAEFAKNTYTISTESANPEWGTTDGDTTALYLEEVPISATPNYGYHFVRWNDGNNSNPRTITMTENKTYQAIFAKNVYSITKVSTSTQGSISGLSQAEYLDNVTLSASPNYGYHFTQWSDGNTDNPRTFVLTQDTTFTAEFAKNGYTITTESSNNEWGTTAGDTTALYLDDIQISATANYGYHFAYWSDGNYSNPRTITVTENKTYYAVFEKNLYSITKQCNSDQGYIDGNSQAEYLDEVTITAIPNYGYHFVQWSDGLKTNLRSFVITKDTTFTAEFAVDRTGTCGNDWALTWRYDPTAKALTISGNGIFAQNIQCGVEARTALQQVIFEKGVTEVGASAFANCSNLKTLIISEDVKKIGEQAFYNCENLTAIYNYRPTPTTVYSNTFDGVEKFECTLHVLASSVDMYKAATGWSEFFYVEPIGAEEATTSTDEVTVETTDNTATMTWPTDDNAASYTIQITKDGVVFCTLIFNSNGQLIGIAFAPSRDRQSQPLAAKQVANGLQFTVTGLNSATHYAFSLTAKDSQETVLASYTGEFTTTGVATAIDQITNDKSQTTKIIKDNQIFILRGDKVYTVTGQEVK